MNTLHEWQIVCDIALAISVLFIALRFVQRHADSSQRQTQALEESLRRLLDEADTASRSLATELTRRHNALERLLMDLESGEARISRALTSVDQAADMLEVKSTRAREKSRHSLVEQIEIKTSNEELLEPAAEINFSQAPARAFGQNDAGLNIYGEPIPSPKPPTINNARPQNNPARSNQSIGNDIEKIYIAAEAMLRAGKDINEIQRATKIPHADLEMLHEVVQREFKMGRRPVAADRSDKPGNDPRLGVLAAAGIKRAVQTL